MSDLKTEQKLRCLLALLEQYRQGGLAVAFSGGVDSTLLAAAAFQVLGSKLLLVNFCNPLEAAADRHLAVDLAVAQGWPFVQLAADPLSLPQVAANTRERCYHCKSLLYRLLRQQAAEMGITACADGNNSDDLAVYRPGSRAGAEQGIVHPLVEVALTKAEIRALARQLQLPNWQRPAAGCLASRFPYGQPLTEDALRRVEAGEALLRQQGFDALRLRVHGDVARIELPREQLPQLLACSGLAAQLRQLGYRYITADLEGLCSGSMDRA